MNRLYRNVIDPNSIIPNKNKNKACRKCPQDIFFSFFHPGYDLKKVAKVDKNDECSQTVTALLATQSKMNKRKKNKESSGICGISIRSNMCTLHVN